MKTALVLVDIQNDYFPGGKMELVGSVEAGQMASQALALFRKKGFPVFHIQHLATRPEATFFIPGTSGADIHTCVTPQDAEAVIQKNFPNSFRNTVLLEKLQEQKIERIVVAGMMTHMCIDTTVRAAADLGLSCVLLHDACATRDLSFGTRTVSAADVQSAFMSSLGAAFAQVKATEEFAL